jgi:hypothetical protein
MDAGGGADIRPPIDPNALGDHSLNSRSRKFGDLFGEIAIDPPTSKAFAHRPNRYGLGHA